MEGNPRLEVASVGVGGKPIPGDGEPVIGAVQAIPGYHVAFSHSGATLGLIVGELLAYEVATGAEPSHACDLQARSGSHSTRLPSTATIHKGLSEFGGPSLVLCRQGLRLERLPDGDPPKAVRSRALRTARKASAHRASRHAQTGC
jgi:hypothetical protein